MPDSPDVLSRPAPPPWTTLRYGPLADHVADVWLPSATPGGAPAPLVVVVHGGFWRHSYDRRHTRPMCHALARAGYTVAAVEYRRTGGEGGWTATFDDVAAALDSVADLVAAAAPARCDRHRVVHVGHSAGGQLAVWAASRHHLPPGSPWPGAAPDPSLRGVVSLAGVLDLQEAARRRLGDGAVQDLLGGEPADVPERYAAADPARLAPAGAPVTLVHGTADDRVPVEVSRSYAAHAGARLTELPSTGHFAVIDPESPVWADVLAAVARLAGM